MEIVESLRLAWRSLRSHKLRSTLTTLGVVIGIATVITLVTLGTSLQADIIGEISGDQTSNMYVWITTPGGGGGPGANTQPVFTSHDVAELNDIAGVRRAIPQVAVPTAALTYRNDTVARSSIIATSPAYLAGQEFARGRNFRMGEREAVLNPLAATQFERNVTVGDEVAIQLGSGRSVNVTVVGILNSSSSLGPFEGFGTQARVYVPADPFYGATIESPTSGESVRVYPLLTISAEDPATIEATQERVQAYLRNRSDAAQLKPESYVFEVSTNEQLLDQVRDILNTLTGFITGVAVISLIVGSIGIANVMLVSVTERTKEIGIMKAVGAQNRDVLQLFLLEAVMLGVLGSILGTLVGIAGAYVATEYIDLPLVFAYQWFGIAVVVGVVVGVVAGLYPAWNAARIDPIDALRYE